MKRFFEKAKDWVPIALCISAIILVLTTAPALMAASEGDLKQYSFAVPIGTTMGTFIFAVIAGPLAEKLLARKFRKQKRPQSKI